MRFFTLNEICPALSVHRPALSQAHQKFQRSSPGQGGAAKTGWDFVGWSTDPNAFKNGLDDIIYHEGDTFDVAAEKEVTLYAQWEGWTKLFYDRNGAAHGSPPLYETDYPELVTKVKDNGSLYKTNFTFAGWNTQPDGLGIHYNEGDEIIIPTGTTVTLYAQWDGPVKLVYNRDGATHGSPPKYETGYPSLETTIAGSGGLYKTDWSFMGWNLTPNANSGPDYEVGASFFSDVEGTTNLYPYWVKNILLTYNNNGGRGNAPQSEKGSPYLTTTIQQAPVGMFKDGYDFGGWNTASDLSNAYSHYDAGTENAYFDKDTILYAQWNKRFTVQYNLNGGSGTLPEPHEFTVAPNETVVKDLADGTELVAPSHYHFTGWSLDSEGNTAVNKLSFDYNTEGSYNSTNKRYVLTVYATWKEDQKYEVSYALADGSPACTLPDTQSYYADTPVPIATAPTAAGYTFNGWSDDVTVSMDGSFNMPAKSVKFIGSFTANTYSIIYDDNKTTYNNIEVKHLPTTPEAFDITKTVESGGKRYYTFLGKTADGETPAALGYVFKGWGRNPSDKPADAVTQIEWNADVINYTVYAIWEEWQYTLSYSPGDEHEGVAVPETVSGLSFGDLRMGNIKLSTTVPVHDGYEFTGWKMQTGGRIYSVADFNDSVKMTVTEDSFDENRNAVAVAQWIPITTPPPETLTITYLPGQAGGTAVAGDVIEDNIAKGSSTNLRAKDTYAAPDGYEFDGWQPDKSGYPTEAGATISKVTENVTFTAMWKEKSNLPPGSYKITYSSGCANDLGSNLSIVKEEIITGTSYTVRDNAGWTNYSRDDYTFAGWQALPASGGGAAPLN